MQILGLCQFSFLALVADFKWSMKASRVALPIATGPSAWKSGLAMMMTRLLYLSSINSSGQRWSVDLFWSATNS